MIKTVFIDIDDTLLDFDKCAEKSMENAFKIIGESFRWEYFDVFTKINTDLWKKLEKHIITKDDVYGKRWNTIFAMLGIEYGGEKFEKIFLDCLNRSAICVPHAKELLAYLKGKYEVCAASNASYNQQMMRLESADMLKYIDHVFTSEKIGYEKPDKRFFDTCLKKLGRAKAQECIMIGDSLSADICGGVGCGMKTCWFNPKKKKNENDVSVDYTVYSLLEIENIL